MNMQASNDKGGDKPIEINLYDHVIMGAVKIVEQTFRVALPGITTSWAHDTMRWSGDAALRYIGLDFLPHDEPGMMDLPLITPRGGGYGMHFDLKPDDPVVILACDGQVRGYYETGTAVTPDITVGHQYGTAVAFPGGKTSSSSPGQASPPPQDPGTCWVGAEDGSATIRFSGAGLPNPAELGTVVISAAGATASVKLGGPHAEKQLAVAEAVMNVFNSLLDVFVTQWVPPAAPAIDNGAALKVLLTTWANTVLPTLLIGDLKVVGEGTGVP